MMLHGFFSFVSSKVGTGNARSSWDATLAQCERLFKAALPVAFGVIFSCSAAAQSAQFISAETYVSSLYHPLGIAADLSGNVYITDPANNRILKETLSAGSYTQSVLPSSTLSSPSGVAVDPAGNVYIADTLNSRVLKETPSAGSYTESIVDDSLPYPISIAADSSGNVYIADFNSSQVFKDTLSAGVYTQSVILNASNGFNLPLAIAVDANGSIYLSAASSGNYQILKFTSSGGGNAMTAIGSGLNQPNGVVVDSLGNVYVADTQNSRVVKETLSAGVYTQSDVASSPLKLPYGIAVDAGGNLYIGDNQYSFVLKESPSGGNFGAVPVGTTSDPMVLFFNLGADAPLGGKAVVTGGEQNMDFAEANLSTCVVGQGSTNFVCTVNAKFTPMLPGARFGAVVLKDGDGNALATGYIQGVGTGPLLNYLPGAQYWRGSGMYEPTAIAVDENLNAFVADSGNNRVVKIGINNNNQSIVPTGALNQPMGVAADGAGNIYIADWGNSRVLKETPTGSSYTESTVDSNLNGAMAVAVDGSGNVYACDWNGHRALKDTPSPSGYIQSTVLDTSGGLINCLGIAVDANGNVYIDDNISSVVYKETPSAGGYIQSIIGSGELNSPASVAVDSNGNLYIADAGNARVVKETPSGGSYTQTTVIHNNSGNVPSAVAADSFGNVFVVMDSSGSILYIDNFEPLSLTFPSTNVGSISAAQTVMLENIGNDTLTFPRPADGSNPLTSSNYNWNPSLSHACPEVLAYTPVPSWTLPAGGFCMLTITFEPTTTGNLSGSITLTDNNIYGGSNYSMQGLSFLGVGLSSVQPQAITFTDGLPTSAIYGQNGNSYTISATGGGSGNPVTFGVSGPATLSGSTLTITRVGLVTITADQAGNSNYSAAPQVSQSINIYKASSTVSVTSSLNPAFVKNTVIFTATVGIGTGGGPTGIRSDAQPMTGVSYTGPTGTVTFMDGTTPLCSTVPLTSGTATCTVNSPSAPLSLGSHSITAVYNGDANFFGSSSNTLTQSVADFAITMQNASFTVIPGKAAVYTFTVIPVSPSTIFPAAIGFSASGLPTGATAVFAPTSAGPCSSSCSTSVTLTIQTVLGTTTAANTNTDTGNTLASRLAPFSLALLLLPFVGRLRKAGRRFGRMLPVLLLLLAGMAAMAGMSGCNSTIGFFGQAQQSYTVGVTGTSGTLSHTSNVTLTVE